MYMPFVVVFAKDGQHPIARNALRLPLLAFHSDDLGALNVRNIIIWDQCS